MNASGLARVVAVIALMAALGLASGFAAAADSPGGSRASQGDIRDTRAVDCGLDSHEVPTVRRTRLHG